MIIITLCCGDIFYKDKDDLVGFLFTIDRLVSIIRRNVIKGDKGVV